MATAGSTEEKMAEGRGGIDANGGRGLGSAEGAPLPLNQGDFFAFTPVFGRFRRFFGAGQRPEDQTRNQTRGRGQIRSDAGPRKHRSDQTGARTDKTKPDGGPDRSNRRAPSV